MASATLEPKVTTVTELIAHFGPSLAGRMRLYPSPGTATVEDVIRIYEREKRLFELVDGILVEKTMGFQESRLAFVLGLMIELFAKRAKLGIVLVGDGIMRLSPDQVRIPDVSFISISQFPDGKLPKAQVPSLHPDLAVEVLSPSNTRAEMDRKLRDYFESGTTLVWYMDPVDRSVRVYTSPEQMTLIDESGTLDGGELLPGFTVTVRDWFLEAEVPS